MRINLLVVCLLSTMVLAVSSRPGLPGTNGVAWAQVDGTPLDEWIYPGAKGRPSNDTVYLTTAWLWTPDEFEKVVEFYAAKAGYNTLHGHFTEFIRKARTGSMGGKNATLFIEQHDEVRNAVITHRGEQRTVSIHMVRGEKDENTRIILIAEEHKERKLPPRPDPFADFLKEFKEWEFPNAKRGGAAGGNVYKMGQYESSEGLRSVLDFYVKKIEANVSSGFLDSAHAVLDDKNLIITNSKRGDAHTVTLTRVGDDQTMFVLLSRAAGEAATHITLLRQSRGPTSTAALDDEVFKEWEAQGAKQHAISKVGGIRAAVYSTLESFKSVAEAYAMKVGVQRIPNFERGSGTVGGGVYLIATDIRADLYTTAFVKHTDKHAITLVLSRGANEGETYVTVIAQAK